MEKADPQGFVPEELLLYLTYTVITEQIKGVYHPFNYEELLVTTQKYSTVRIIHKDRDEQVFTVHEDDMEACSQEDKELTLTNKNFTSMSENKFIIDLGDLQVPDEKKKQINDRLLQVLKDEISDYSDPERFKDIFKPTKDKLEEIFKGENPFPIGIRRIDERHGGGNG